MCLSAPHIANIAWAFAKAGKADEGLFGALARSVEGRAGEFAAPDLANIAWAFSNAGVLDARLFAALARAAEHKLDDFTDEARDNAEWAFGKAGQQRVVKALRQRRKRAAESQLGGDAARAEQEAAGVDVSACGRILVAGVFLVIKALFRLLRL